MVSWKWDGRSIDFDWIGLLFRRPRRRAVKDDHGRIWEGARSPPRYAPSQLVACTRDCRQEWRIVSNRTFRQTYGVQSDTDDDGGRGRGRRDETSAGAEQEVDGEMSERRLREHIGEKISRRSAVEMDSRVWTPGERPGSARSVMPDISQTAFPRPPRWFA